MKKNRIYYHSNTRVIFTATPLRIFYQAQNYQYGMVSSMSNYWDYRLNTLLVSTLNKGNEAQGSMLLPQAAPGLHKHTRQAKKAGTLHCEYIYKLYKVQDKQERNICVGAACLQNAYQLNNAASYEVMQYNYVLPTIVKPAM